MRSAAARLDIKTARDALGVLADPDLDPIAAPGVAAVFAHPDDETIACGAQLSRLRGLTIVLVTDGAPRDLYDAQRAGFTTAEDYADARERELAAALEFAGIHARRIFPLGMPDQQAALRLTHITLTLGKIFADRGIRVVITHAYEGGHPDHDATAFCVHAAATLRRRTGQSLDIIEAPLYRLGAHSTVRQQFADGSAAEEIVVPLTPAQQELKRRMMAAHHTQREQLAPFATDVERFRAVPHYDFSELPNGGRLLYDNYAWGINGTRWIELARSALADLALVEAPC
jgi:LmbE family N-acetylglucosaminyl deacetylase